MLPQAGAEIRVEGRYAAVKPAPIMKLAVECPDRSGSATLRLPQPAGSLAEGRFGRGRLLQHDKQGRAIAIGQLSRLDPAQGAFGGDFQLGNRGRERISLASPPELRRLRGMPRRKRMYTFGSVCHVLNRSVGRATIFRGSCIG
jgi:hypothetical protein